jgi:hypothetical protein
MQLLAVTLLAMKHQSSLRQKITSSRENGGSLVTSWRAKMQAANGRWLKSSSQLVKVKRS